jgi:predicted dienelactone hydrolase
MNFRRWSVLILAVGPAALSADLPDPRRPGPFPVGVTTVVFVDPTRECAASKGPRVLPTEIWYPAADDARDLPKNRVSDFLFRGQSPPLSLAFRGGFRVSIEDADARFRNRAVRDARVRDGRFPLIVFSHGNGGVRFQSTFWCDHMASHGYIVVSCDHTGNAAATLVRGKIVLGGASSREQSAKDRPADVSFLIDRMAAFDSGEDSRFAGRVDASQVAVAGHSFGGFTAGAVLNSDQRVKAVVPMAAVFGERKTYATPLLLFVATEDKTLGVEGNRRAIQYFEDSTGPKYLVEIRDAGHFSFSDMFQYRPDFGDGVGRGKRVTRPDEELEFLGMDETYEIADSYSTAFLGVHLKGEQGYRPFLERNNFPEAIDFRFAAPSEPPPTPTN